MCFLRRFSILDHVTNADAYRKRAAHFCVDLDQGIVRVGPFARVPAEQAAPSLSLESKDHPGFMSRIEVLSNDRWGYRS
jgi:hypothetical protein